MCIAALIAAAAIGSDTVSAAEVSVPEAEDMEQEVVFTDGEYPEEALIFVSDQTAGEISQVWDSVSDLPFGNAGRLYSEDIGISVKLEHYDMMCEGNTNAEAQSIVNRPDSAIWMDYHIRTMVIGDHYNQGFEAIKQSVPGETVLYLASPDGIQRYICRKVQKGHNNGETILAEDGTDLLLSDPGGLLLYTCDGCWQNIFIAQYEIDAE